MRHHYAYLRKVLGEKKETLLQMIRKVGNTEQRKVNDILYTRSAEREREKERGKKERAGQHSKAEQRLYILLGDLTGIRDRSRGRRMNRIVANMPFFKLMQYVTYKASWESVPVLTTKEWYSSKFATDAAVIIRQGHIRACSCVMPVVTLATPITMEQLIPETG